MCDLCDAIYPLYRDNIFGVFALLNEHTGTGDLQRDAMMRDARDPRLHRQRREKMKIVKEEREARKKY